VYTNWVYLAFSNAYQRGCVCGVHVCVIGGAKEVKALGLYPTCQRRKEGEGGDGW
jgi:hypothetical protein